MYRALKMRLKKLTKHEEKILERLTYHAKNVWNNTLWGYKNNKLPDKPNSLRGRLYAYARSTDDGMMLHSQSVSALTDQLYNSIKKKDRVHFMPPDGHRTVIWPYQAIKIESGKIKLPLSRTFREAYNVEGKYLELPLPGSLKINPKAIKQVSIVPKANAKWFEMIITYDVEPAPRLSGEHVMGIDLGIDNFATIAISDGSAYIIDGRKAKSFNRWINKERARLQSIYAKQGIKTGNKMVRLMLKRANWFHNFLHQAAVKIIEIAKAHNVNKIAVGHNKGWKHGTKLGKHNTQNFLSLPHTKFITILQHKAELNGIEFTTVQESYTSKTDALALEPIGQESKGRRKYRGLYISSIGIAINADVNGAINIARKAFGDEYWKRIPESVRIGGSGRLSRPVRIRVV